MQQQSQNVWSTKQDDPQNITTQHIRKQAQGQERWLQMKGGGKEEGGEEEEEGALQGHPK